MEEALRILHIWVSPGHDFVGRHGKGRLDHGLERVSQVTCVAGQGIEGDRYFGHRENYKGQITFFSEAVARDLEQSLDGSPVDRSAFRRNVLIEGPDLNSLIGVRFQIGDLVFSGSEECSPCYWMDTAVAQGTHAFLKGRGGLRCRIEKGGVLQTGSHTLTRLS